MNFRFGVFNRTVMEELFSDLVTAPPTAMMAHTPDARRGRRPPAPSASRAPPPPPPARAADVAPGRVPCRGHTVSNEPCKNAAKPGMDYCYAHRGACPTKNEQCPICLEDFSTTPAVSVFLLSCAHQLHVECMQSLRTDSCPICRRTFTNLPKELFSRINERKTQDAAERTEEDVREAMEHVVGGGMHITFRPVVLATNAWWPQSVPPPAEPSAEGGGQRSSLFEGFTLTDFFEDFIVRLQVTSTVGELRGDEPRRG